MAIFGICCGVDQAAAARAAGWDFVEANVQSFLQPRSDTWSSAATAMHAAIPVRAANCLIPADLKITGTAARPDLLETYMALACARAAEAGIRVLVFGSGAARMVPTGFDVTTARRQIVDFLTMAAPLAGAAGLMLAVEPLNRGECNIINSIAEAAGIAEAVDHSAVGLLFDSFHSWKESEPLETVEKFARGIGHVHVADLDGRVLPGRSGGSDYRPLFAMLQRAGYDGAISVEASGTADVPATASGATFLRKQWNEA